jgi:hypothetical protein
MWYIVSSFVNVTKYPQYNNNMIIKTKTITMKKKYTWEFKKVNEQTNGRVNKVWIGEASNYTFDVY